MKVTAGLVIIGNEILSGRTKDANLGWLATELNQEGIQLVEVRVVADVPEAIIEAVNALRHKLDYVFTTGGIGPTHDDITCECIAKAFGVEVHRHPEAEAMLRSHYTNQADVNEARLRMANVPHGAVLVPNAVSKAPGFRMENVYTFAGVPRIMQAMFDAIRHELKGGAPVLSATVTVFLTEGSIAAALSEIQDTFPEVEIGSYPLIRDGRLGTSLVARSTDKTQVEAAREAITAMLQGMNGEIIENI